MSDACALAAEFEEALAQVPLFDAHTHLVGNHLGARGLHDILLYHMVISDLYGAGCPSGARLTQYPDWPTTEEAHQRLTEAIPYLGRIQNTSCSWGLRLILQDLYDWHEPITPDNWRQLDGLIRERADDRTWWYSVLDRLNIQRTCTESARRENGEDDVRLQYSIEWCFFTRCQWGEFDTALYELERAWGRSPEFATPIGGGQRPPTDRTIRSLEDVHAAVTHYVDNIPYDLVISTAAGISTDIDFRPVSDAEMLVALLRRPQAGPTERDIYASYINEAFLTGLEERADRIVYQFSLGAEPLPFETGSRLAQRTIGQLAEMIARHPRLRFQCFVSSRHANQSLCTLARELPNFSLAGYWWHNFFPDIIRQIFAERLDMLPVNKQVGFFSDAYCVEWVYGKLILVRKQMARVLADKVKQGQYTRDDALAVAKAILYDSPQSLLGMVPKAPNT
jgi:glucuronate isomerase